MAREIERKFLVNGFSWRTPAGIRIRQGYLSTDKERTVRVRTVGGRAFLTIKGSPVGLARPEFEYAIPVHDAVTLLDQLCPRPLIEKTRHRVVFQGHTWEVDEFSGANNGLVLAEIELADEDEAFARPEWLGEEVTHDPRYYNAALVAHPYGSWPERSAQ